MRRTVVVAGVSGRGAAESAARAGWHVTALDAFGDLDQHADVHAVSLPGDLGVRFSPTAAARAARDVEADAAAYLSSFENHPAAVRALARGRVLLGNAPDILRRVRDPFVVASSLERRGVRAPTVAHDGLGESAHPWVLKPVASGGGHRVRVWRPGRRVPGDCYLQQHVAGSAGSLLFVAAGTRGVPLALTTQLVGDHAFGATGFRYCGSLLTRLPSDDGPLLEWSGHITRVLAEEFALVGVGGVDFVVADGVPWPIEVNPRWTASMELIERASGWSVFSAHAAACLDGVLPAPFAPLGLRKGGRTLGKAIVFARAAGRVGDTRRWLADPDLRDVPRPGERFAAGSPVCTVFAEADDAVTCRTALVARADRVYAELASWGDRVA